MSTPVTGNDDRLVDNLLDHPRGAFIQGYSYKYNDFSHKTCLLPFKDLVILQI